MKAIDICFPCEILISKHTPQGKKKKKKNWGRAFFKEEQTTAIIHRFFFSGTEEELDKFSLDFTSCNPCPSSPSVAKFTR